MTTVFPNSEVWVVHDEHALLYRQREHMWQLENKIPFAEFSGSALALSSFTLPDTRVYVNLCEQKQTASQYTEMSWIGVRQDPMRLIEIKHTPQTQQILEELRSMGKQVRVVSVENPQYFIRAIPIFLASRQEQKHLKKWVSDQKSAANPWLSNSRLWLSMWANPDRPYQKLRAAAVGCTLLTLLFTQWSNSRQLDQYNSRTQAAIKHEIARAATVQHRVSFDGWALQIKKFGQGNRANLTSLSFHWASGGTIHTFVQLDRDRKRVPKGCELLNSKRAQCQTNATQP